MSSQTLTLASSGLYLGTNTLSSAPEGAMTEADNCVLSRDGILEPRPGWDLLASTFGSAPDRAQSLTSYLAQVFARTSAHKLVGSSGGAFTDYSGSASVTVPSGATRVRFAQAGGSLFITSGTGLQKLDGLSSVVAAPGQLKGSISNLGVIDIPASNWMPSSQVAYRAIISKTDAQGRLIRGAPSGRLVVPNSSGATRVPAVEVVFPPGLTTEHTVSLYRSAASASVTDEPSDEMGLVYEAKPTSTNISNGYMSVTDYSPDVLRGAALYTNGSQEGIAQGNDPPPIAQDVCLWKDCLFLANTTARQRLIIDLLAVDGSLGVGAGDRLVLGGFSFVGAASADQSIGQFAVITSGSPSQNIRRTAESLIYVINRRASATLFAQYLSTPDERPGKILIEERSIGGSAFPFAVSAHQTAWNPSPPLSKTINAASLVRSGSTVTATTTTSHGFTVGQQVQISTAVPDANFPTGQIVVVSTPTSTSFTYTQAGAATSSASVYDAAPITELSTAERGKNRVYVSKPGEYEAFPLGNWFDVGDGQEIARVIPLRDSVVVLKPDGVFRITGEAGAFSVSLLDPTVQVFSPDSAVAVSNQIFAWTNQGVVAISDGGAQVVSRPIDEALRPLAAGSLRTPSQSLSFGVGYETSRLFILWTPTEAADTYCTQAWVYSLTARGWTRWDIPAAHVAVGAADDRLWIAATGSNTLGRERKDLAASDYLDPGYTDAIWAVGSGLSAANVLLNDLYLHPEVEAGWIIYQPSTGLSSRIEEIVNPPFSITARMADVLAWDFSGPGSEVQVLQPIDFLAEWVPVTGDNPATRKQFREVQLLLNDGAFQTATLSFATDMSPAFESAGTVTGPGITSDGRKIIRASVPRSKQRATQLRVRLAISIANFKFSLNGMAVIFNAGSARVRK